MREAAIRLAASAAVAAAGAAAAVAAGAPPVAALLALLAGAAALALARARDGDGGAGSPPADEADDAPLPGIAELLQAVDEPLLVVRDRRVAAANDAARTLLGAHIDGVDVRLAIRHPAAAERLAGAAEAEDGPARIDLVGLGDPSRQWTMTVTPLPEGSRLVRLSDQSEARAVEQMRVDFVANASHELRTPLATVLGFIETLQDDSAGGDPATRARFLKIMSDEAGRMRNLLDDLMSLSRIEAERFTAPRDPVALLPLIDEVKTGLAQLVETRGSVLAVENEAGNPIVPGDRPQLAQMLNNLLVNAIRYGRDGGEVRIAIDAAGPDLIRLRIIDDGEGIAAEHLPRLTERFYRIDAGRSRSVGGTGLGLAIVKHIVLRHRGRLDIASTAGRGTEVSVWLPRATEPAVTGSS